MTASTILWAGGLDLPFLLQDEVVTENNMKMEVTGKLKTHFNNVPKQNNTTAGVSVIMVSYYNHYYYWLDYNGFKNSVNSSVCCCTFELKTVG